MTGNVYLGKRKFEALKINFVFNRHYWGHGHAAESCNTLIWQVFAHGVRQKVSDSAPSCPYTGANVTILQDSLYVTDCYFAPISHNHTSLQHNRSPKSIGGSLQGVLMVCQLHHILSRS